MIRDLRAFGLALVTVLVMSGTVASAAWGTHPQFTAGEYPAILDGTQTKVLVFNREGRTVTCSTAEFDAELTKADTALTVEPTYSGCHSNIPLVGVVPATVTMNGCDYVLHVVEGKEPGVPAATVDLECPEGKEIEVHVYTNHTNHTKNTSLCTFKIPEQTGLSSVDLTNKAGTPEDVEADIDLSKITSSVTPSNVVCGNSHDATGTLTGSATFEATNAAKEEIDFTAPSFIAVDFTAPSFIAVDFTVTEDGS
jgi:hypothetical protein